MLLKLKVEIERFSKLKSTFCSKYKYLIQWWMNNTTNVKQKHWLFFINIMGSWDIVKRNLWIEFF